MSRQPEVGHMGWQLEICGHWEIKYTQSSTLGGQSHSHRDTESRESHPASIQSGTMPIHDREVEEDKGQYSSPPPVYVHILIVPVSLTLTVNFRPFPEIKLWELYFYKESIIGLHSFIRLYNKYLKLFNCVQAINSNTGNHLSVCLLVCLSLWYIKICRLFNAKSIFIQILSLA